MKRILLLLVLSLFCLQMTAQRKKVGLVLSGGGAKGVAHIGVLKVLEEAGIPIDYIAGTSMGAIVGALYAIGYDAETLDSLVRQQDWMFLLSDKVYRYNLPFSKKEEIEKYLVSVPISKRSIKMPSGFVSGQNIYNLFLDLTVGYHDSLMFNELPIPFACVASNLVDGSEIIFDRGKLALAMRASMAIPGAFAPVVQDSMVLVDGGIANNFPADVAKAMGADIIIGVDVQSDLKTSDDLESIMAVVDQLTSFLGLAKYEKNRGLADLYIKPDIYPYSAASFSEDAIDTLIMRGEWIAREQWQDILELKKRIGVTDEDVPDKIVVKRFGEEDTLSINRIIMEGCDARDGKWLKSMIRIKNYDQVTMKDIRNAIANLYGSGAFSRVTFRLIGGPKYDLIFSMSEKPTSSLNLGLRFDSEEKAAILLNTTLAYKAMVGSRLSLTGRLSTNPYITLNYSLGNTFLRRLMVSYTYRYNDLSLYYRGKKTDNILYGYHHADLSISNFYFRNFNMQMGVKYEYFDYKSFLYADRDEKIEVKSEGLFGYYITAQYETFDKRYCPNRGMSFNIKYTFYTDNLLHYNDGTPFSTLGLAYEAIIPFSRRVKLIPSLYSRVIIGNNVAYPKVNFVGGSVAGRYISQQLPFYGIKNMELVDNSVVITKLHLRYRMGSKHYVSLMYNYLMNSDNFFDILGGKTMWGGAASYSYDAFIGPIDFALTYSNRTKKLSFMFNLGYYF